MTLVLFIILLLAYTRHSTNTSWKKNGKETWKGEKDKARDRRRKEKKKGKKRRGEDGRGESFLLATDNLPQYRVAQWLVQSLFGKWGIPLCVSYSEAIFSSSQNLVPKIGIFPSQKYWRLRVVGGRLLPSSLPLSGSPLQKAAIYLLGEVTRLWHWLSTRHCWAGKWLEDLGPFSVPLSGPSGLSRMQGRHVHPCGWLDECLLWRPTFSTLIPRFRLAGKEQGAC